MLVCAALALALLEVPAPLRCLERWYAVRAEVENGRWAARLPSGTRLPYDDGKAKTFAAMLEDPDLEDVFSIRYERGAIKPVAAVNRDPGRIRLEALFEATYGRSRKEVEVVPMVFFGQKVRVHRKVAPAFRKVAERLARVSDSKRFVTRLGGTFAWRNIAGTRRKSAHSYGIAIDLNAAESNYWRWQKAPLRWQNKIPQPIVDAFEEEGFIWGGRWYHYDTMHFEYRPELLDRGCYPEK